jgi:glutaredoxin
MNIRTTLLLLTLFVSSTTQAEIYTWKDAQGHTHFGDRKPSDSASSQLELEINTIHNPEVLRLESTLSNNHQVVIYTTDWCGVCRQAKGYFKQNRISYKEYDVEKSSKGRRDYKRLKGTGVPIILIGEQRMNGFSPERFDKLYRQP